MRKKIDGVYNFTAYPQGYTIKISSITGKFYYSFNSQMNPREFLISKGINV
jgi:hypothetical protein